MDLVDDEAEGGGIPEDLEDESKEDCDNDSEDEPLAIEDGVVVGDVDVAVEPLASVEEEGTFRRLGPSDSVGIAETTFSTGITADTVIVCN
jgi:hypothetical protein